MLYYPPLSSKQSYKIWETNLQRLQAQSEARIKNGMPRLIIRKKSILSFAKTNFKQLNWNGRQIRNAFQSALALAVFNASHTKSKRSNPVVSKREFRTVGDFVKQFESYLKETHQGVGEASIALEDEVRADMVDGRQGGLEISDTEYSDSESEDEYLTKSGNSEEQDEPSAKKSSCGNDDSEKGKSPMRMHKSKAKSEKEGKGKEKEKAGKKGKGKKGQKR